MRDFKVRNKIKKRVYSKLVIVILIVILLFILKGVWGIYEKVKMSELKLQSSEEELQKLSERENVIAGQIKRLQTDTGLEEEIRSKYNVAKEGERAIVILEGDEPIIVQPEPEGFIEKLKSWFKD